MQCRIWSNSMHSGKNAKEPPCSSRVSLIFAMLKFHLFLILFHCRVFGQVLPGLSYEQGCCSVCHPRKYSEEEVVKPKVIRFTNYSACRKDPAKLREALHLWRSRKATEMKFFFSSNLVISNSAIEEIVQKCDDYSDHRALPVPERWTKEIFQILQQEEPQNLPIASNHFSRQSKKAKTSIEAVDKGGLTRGRGRGRGRGRAVSGAPVNPAPAKGGERGRGKGKGKK